MSVKTSFIQRAKILLFTRVASSAEHSKSIDSNTGGGECTSCQLCVVSCPEKLDPSKLIALVSLASRPTLTSTTQAEKVDDLIANNLAACTACGICTEACPSNAALASLLARGRELVGAEERERHYSEHWKARFLARQSRIATTTLSRKANAEMRAEKKSASYIKPEINENQRQEIADAAANNQTSIGTISSFSRATAQDDIAAAVARVKAKREAKLAAATRTTRGDSE